MPFVLLFIGAMLTVSAVQNTQSQLFTLLKGDFTGNGNFAYWVLAIVAIGSVGYFAPLRKVVNTFLLLMFAVFLLANKGFFTQLNTALNGALTPAPAGAMAFPGLALGGNAEASAQAMFANNPQGAKTAIQTSLTSALGNGVNTIQALVNQFGPSGAQGFNAASAAASISKLTGIGPNDTLTDAQIPAVANGFFQFSQSGIYNPTVYN